MPIMPPAVIKTTMSELDLLFGKENFEPFERVETGPFRMGLAELHMETAKQPERCHGVTMSHQAKSPDVVFGTVVKGTRSGVELEPKQFVAICKQPHTSDTGEQALISALTRWSCLFISIADEQQGQPNAFVRVYLAVRHARRPLALGVQQTVSQMSKQLDYYEACGAKPNRSTFMRMIERLSSAGDYRMYIGKMDDPTLRLQTP